MEACPSIESTEAGMLDSALMPTQWRLYCAKPLKYRGKFHVFKVHRSGEDWLVVEPVSSELVSGQNSLHTGVLQGISFRIWEFCISVTIIGEHS